MGKFQIIHWAFPPVEVNTYLIGDPDSGECFCIDPGGEPDLIIKDIEKKNWKLKGIVLTHAHFDHLMGVGPLHKKIKVPVYLHPDDLHLYRMGPEISRQFLGIDMEPPPEPVKELREKPLSLGNNLLIVLHTPGHSPGSCSLYGGGCLFTGDLLFKGSVGRTDFPDSSYEELMNSLIKKILTLPPETQVFPGHGSLTTLMEEIENNPFLKEALKYDRN